MRCIGWIRVLSFVCAGVCAAPLMVAQTDTNHKNGSTSGTVYKQQQRPAAAQRPAPAATAAPKAATNNVQKQASATTQAPSAASTRQTSPTYTRPLTGGQLAGASTSTPGQTRRLLHRTDFGPADDDACVARGAGEDFAEYVGAVRNACDDFGWEPKRVVDFVGYAFGIFREDTVNLGWAETGDGNACYEFGWTEARNCNDAIESGRIEAFNEYAGIPDANADAYRFLSAAIERETECAAYACGGIAANTDTKAASADCSAAGFFAAWDSAAGVTAGQPAGDSCVADTLGRAIE